MRKSIISSTVVVALAIPSAAGAQTVDPGGHSVIQKPARKAVRKVPVKKVRKAKAGAPDEAAENPDGSRRSAKSSPSPPCALSQQSSEIARRCLRLSRPGELSPVQSVAVASPLAKPAGDVRFASTSRTWLGGVSKAIIAALVRVAESRSADQDEPRDAMAADIQWELTHVRVVK